MLKSILTRLYGSLTSKHPAAYLGIFIKLLTPICQTVDSLLLRHLIKKNDAEHPKCLMLVSPPRSGSTITYQVLTRMVPCVYISNLHALFPYSASYFLSKYKKFGKDLEQFKNYYGYTSRINDVNEGNEMIDKIFKNRPELGTVRKRFNHFLKQMAISDGHPIIFKNVRNYCNIEMLHKACPDLVFLYIKRDIEQVIQSELKAHYELGTFHPIPDSMKGEKVTDPIDFAVRQILEMTRIIDEQKKQIQPDHWIEWEYETFCLNTIPMIEMLLKEYLEMDISLIRKSALKEPLKPSYRKKVSDEESVEIKRILAKYASKTS